jgi:hypothetical protein
VRVSYTPVFAEKRMAASFLFWTRKLLNVFQRRVIGANVGPEIFIG